MRTGFALADLRSGLRTLRRYPTLSLVAIVTFGLGIGLTATCFSVVNGAMFTSLPFDDPGRIVSIGQVRRGDPDLQGIDEHDLEVYDNRLTVFAAFGAFDNSAVNLSTDERHPERVSAGLMTVRAFATLGVKPDMGRGLQDGDDRMGADPIVLLGDEIWRRKFDADPLIISRKVRVGGVVRTVVGVMPATFGFPILEKLWIPLVVNPAATPRGQGPSHQLVGRLKPGASITQARTEARAIAAQLAVQYPKTNQDVTANVYPYGESVLGSEAYALLYTMLGAGIGVLLIACVNVSNLLVARASLRRREVAVRMALGAGRGRVIRQHLTEVVVLAGLGAVMGLAITRAAMAWFVDSLSVDPPPFWMTFDVDYRVLMFVAGLVVFAALVAGALPSAHAARIDPASAMKDDSRSSTTGRLGRFSAVLVVVELALSCGLLIAAGLMTKSVVQLKTVKMPFAVAGILTARIDLPGSAYKDDAARVRFYELLLPRGRAIPGVEAATLSDGLPAAGNGAVPIQIDGRVYAQDSDYPDAREGIVTPGYFDTFQTHLVSGREFQPSDDAKGAPVALVNQSFAREFFPGVDPVGRRMRRGRGVAKNPWLTIIGVAPDMLMQGIGNTGASPAGYYVPFAQSGVGGNVRIALRTRGEEAAMTSALRAAVAALDNDLALYDVSPMDVVIRRQTWFYTVFGTFFTAFGLAALFLASAGLYGVMSFAVTLRTRELSVRAALGARRGQLIMLVMRRSMIQLAIGLLLGVLLALAASDPLHIVLYYVDPRDPVVFTTVVLTLALAGLTASFLPARRASSVDPAAALAAE
jgi:predicted permease